MNDFIRVLMRRDGLSLESAQSEFQRAVQFIHENDPFELEEFLLYEFGLEPDYVLDVLYGAQ